MKGFVPPDPQTNVSQEHCAVIYAPRRNRTRFPAGCVDIVDTPERALALADEAKKTYPARVLGPSKSSEGQYIYYLMQWLDEA
ncbi:MAG: hypothetical protein HUJ30_07020 [Gammaproteobacteria bacterium]|nr:hypothetical protein [Gammaproteobacteria bacterium]